MHARYCTNRKLLLQILRKGLRDGNLEPVLIVCQGQQAHLHGVLDFETAVTCLAYCGVLREGEPILHTFGCESSSGY